MSELPGRLGTLLARDVMTSNVVTLKNSDTICAAVSTLREHDITGAPVVDDAGNLVGILSMSDLLPATAATEPRENPSGLAEPGMAWNLFDAAETSIKEIDEETVASRMSTVVRSVLETATLVSVARAMCDGHWHRVPVVSNSGSVAGIVSTMDVLAAMINAADERSGVC